MNHYKQLSEVLNDIFELNKADLDFGIYRIINQKRKQVNDFIENQLPNDIKQALSQTSSTDKTEIEKELKTLKKNLDDAGIVAESSPKYKTLMDRLDLVENSDVLEQEVFSHLANFFRRYYKDGDFISMRRYKKDVYAIPYEGEEVKLHWANHDQYYIKSSENFKNYSFNAPDGKRVTFQLKEVSTEQNNNKTQGDAERRFALYNDESVEVIGDELVINFIYEPFPKTTKQDNLIADALEILSEKVPATFASIFVVSPTEKNSKRTVLERHLQDYVSKNSFDYFIHKDLGGFLSRELDYYIKNEVLYIDDINTTQTDFFVAQLSKIKAIKVVAQKVIDFLAQIENFQKKLWLKKKFVISTQYCITLDKIPSSYYREIFDNKDQIAEWKTLFDVDIQNEGELVFEPYLVLDTKFFSESFKDRLLAEFDDLDEQTNGLLINSENFQALNLMQEKYQEKIDVTYIDPPYNTGKDDFAYKDSFRHSSWMSFIFDRLELNNKLLNPYSGAFLGNIDKRELYNFKSILDSIFSEENFVNAIVNVNNPKGRSDQKHLPTAHDNILFYAKDSFISYGWEPTDKVLKRYNKQEGDNVYREIDLRKTGDNDRRIDRPNLFYFFYFNENTKEIEISREKRIDLTEWVEIAPMKSQNEEGNWRWEMESAKRNLDRLIARYMPVKGQWSIFEKDYYIEGDRVLPTSIWDEKPFNNERGTESFINLGFDKDDFPRPKPVGLIEYLIEHTTSNRVTSLFLDYFLGSGTSISSILKVNKSSGNKRKYIGIEMGEYFKKIAIIRITKNIYSDNWKNGKPQDKGGISQIVKYQVLESYEDTLNNMFLKTTAELDFGSSRAKEEYLLQYMLELESREHLFNLQMFRKPFDYEIKVTENNELRRTKVDLVETFNYLIGLYVSKVQRVKDIKVVEGTTRTGIKTLVIWRDLDTTTHDDVQKLLRRFYDSQRTRAFQQIYINGDHHLENLRVDGDQFKIKLIEETFFKRMFNEIEM